MLKSAIVSLLVAVVLIGCGGGGGGGSTSSNTFTNSNSNSSTLGKFFVTDSLNSAIASLDNINPSPGNITVDRIIVGNNTGLAGDSIRDLAYDKTRDLLYVSNGSNILVFNNAGAATGNVAPGRIIRSNAFTFINGMYLDTVNDRLYVAIFGNAAVGEDKVLVFNNASTDNGTLTPSRTIPLTLNGGTFFINDVAVDSTRDTLYVIGAGGTPTYSPRIFIYDNAGTINGSGVSPSRTITLSQSVSMWSLFLDASGNRLYVTGDNVIRVYDSISVASGAVSPARTISLGNTSYVTVDTVNNRLYAISASGVYIVNSASTANGTVTANFAIAPSGSSLRAATVSP